MHITTMRLLANVVNINVESELFTVTPHSLLPPPPPPPPPSSVCVHSGTRTISPYLT